MNFTDIISKIAAAKSAMLFTHVNMDGDAMGSTMALCRVMRKLGIDAHIMVEDKAPRFLQFMDDGSFFLDVEEYRAQGSPAYDLAAAVDIGQDKRLENRVEEFRRAAVSICIDHHHHTSEDCGFADSERRDPSAAAAAVLVQELIEEMEMAKGLCLMDKDVAEDLYIGIMTDTGCFKFSNTDGRAHGCVARLFAQGIDHNGICTKIYESYPEAQLRLEALAMDRMERFADGKACISWCTLKDFEELGADISLADTCIDRLRSVEGVEIAAFIKEKEDGSFKLSTRSKMYANVNAICAVFGGGGHLKASGATFRCSLEEAIAQLKPEIEKELARWTE